MTLVGIFLVIAFLARKAKALARDAGVPVSRVTLALGLAVR
jgi:hypothetical protein